MLLLQASTTVMGNEVLDTLSASAISVAIIQWLKNTKLIPFMDQHTSGINRIVAWVMAFLAGTGIHYQFDHATGTLTLTGLTVATILAYRRGHDQVLRFTVARVPGGEAGIGAHGSGPGGSGSPDTGIAAVPAAPGQK